MEYYISVMSLSCLTVYQSSQVKICLLLYVVIYPVAHENLKDIWVILCYLKSLLFQRIPRGREML